MSKKTTETKPEKQTEKKPPTELSDGQLADAVGGSGSRGPAGTSGDRKVVIDQHGEIYRPA